MVYSLKLYKNLKDTKAFLKLFLVFYKEKLIFIPILKWLKKSVLKKLTNFLNYIMIRNYLIKKKNKIVNKDCNKSNKIKMLIYLKKNHKKNLLNNLNNKSMCLKQLMKNLKMINQRREKLCLIKVMVLKLILIIGLKLQKKLQS